MLNLSNDDFIRTTEPRHHKAASSYGKKCKKRSDLPGHYEGWYAVRDETFYPESEVEKLPDGRVIAKASKAECKREKEPSYMFRLSQWGDKLLEFYDKNPDFIMPASRRNEVISFVKGGLEDLSISRTKFSWGIPVPGDEKHVMLCGSTL